ncbi:hypothetical protein [Flavobacterium dankookense]|uniref:Uncharacterized protein n=1 Tax=Flavobacterium dankookense TaxID=706186 RepID=A0A4V3CSI0_9FLAO|nr:hypothetical protein [Flavobacterium dankookense]TDP60702.1 hypothetical protein BC748_0299 [Flavobacterium dankookense]
MDIELISNKLYETLVSDKLSEIQKEKLSCACKKAILENPQLDYNGWKIASKIYLNFIIDFPDIDLVGIKLPVNKR